MSDHPLIAPPEAVGLYDPRDERDACGVGFVVDIKGRRSHGVVEKGLQVLINLLHRGACGCEANTGDGAGILIQTPDRFLRKVTAPLGITLPPAGQYGTGLVFLPRLEAEREELRQLVERIVGEEGQRVLGWRRVPTAMRASANRRWRPSRSSSRSSLLPKRSASRRTLRTNPNAGRRRSSGSCTSSASGSSTRPTGCRSPSDTRSISRASRRGR